MNRGRVSRLNHIQVKVIQKHNLLRVTLNACMHVHTHVKYICYLYVSTIIPLLLCFRFKTKTKTCNLSFTVHPERL